MIKCKFPAVGMDLIHQISNGRSCLLALSPSASIIVLRVGSSDNSNEQSSELLEDQRVVRVDKLRAAIDARNGVRGHRVGIGRYWKGQQRPLGAAWWGLLGILSTCRRATRLL